MSDCLIIGSGIVGMMCARTLKIAGAEVTLLDKNKCGGESSWAGGGIISPLYPWHCSDSINDLSFASQIIYKKLCDDLHNSSGIDPQYIKSGMLMFDEYNSKKAKVWLQRYKINYSPHPQGALFTHVAQVRNPRLLKALKVDIIKKNINIIEQTQVNNLILKNDNILGVETTKGKFYSTNIIICCGAWSSQLLKTKEEIFPMKGQIIVIKAKAGIIKHIILDRGQYIIPRIDGRILVGSTMENVGFDRSIDSLVKKKLYNFAYSHFSQLKNANIEHHWSGFRPATKTGNIVLKRSEKYTNLFINSGHFRNGINTAPACADKIVDLITN